MQSALPLHYAYTREPDTLPPTHLEALTFR
jgi:hypothetical protein